MRIGALAYVRLKPGRCCSWC